MALILSTVWLIALPISNRTCLCHFSANSQYNAYQPQKQWLSSDFHMYQLKTGFLHSWIRSCENNSHGHVFMIFTLAFSALGQQMGSGGKNLVQI